MNDDEASTTDKAVINNMVTTLCNQLKEMALYSKGHYIEECYITEKQRTGSYCMYLLAVRGSWRCTALLEHLSKHVHKMIGSTFNLVQNLIHT